MRNKDVLISRYRDVIRFRYAYEAFQLKNGSGLISISTTALHIDGKPIYFSWSDGKGGDGVNFVRGTRYEDYKDALEYIRQHIPQEPLPEYRLVDYFRPLIKLCTNGQYIIRQYEAIHKPMPRHRRGPVFDYRAFDSTTDFAERLWNFFSGYIMLVSMKPDDALDQNLVSEWKQKIIEGAEPKIIAVGKSFNNIMCVIDGHHKMKAYRELKKPIPAIAISLATSKDLSEEQSYAAFGIANKYVEGYKQLLSDQTEKAKKWPLREKKSRYLRNFKLPDGVAKEYFVALGTHDYHLVRQLVKDNPKLTKAKDIRHTSALGSAINHNLLDVARNLLEYGANPNAIDNMHSPAPITHHVIGRDNAEALQLLAEYGADLAFEDDYCYTPLRHAVRGSGGRPKLKCVAKILELANQEPCILSDDNLKAIKLEQKLLLEEQKDYTPKSQRLSIHFSYDVRLLQMRYDTENLISILGENI